jgi:serine/threonine protein kinase
MSELATKSCPHCHAELKSEAGKICSNCGKPLEASLSRQTAIFPSDHKTTSSVPDILADCKMLGPYRIERNIGRGGMGFVYEAFDTRLNRRVALKAIESGDGLNQQMVERFRQEAKNGARLRHPNIVPIHDIGCENGFDYFTMELIEGFTLDKWINTTKVSLKDRIVLMEKVCRAIEHAHKQGVIHRDIKPGNIMIDRLGEPHVMDFGLALYVKDTSSFTLSGSILGTPAYMAPEQCVGTREEITPHSDVWALGVILYELLTEKSPFERESVYETIYAVVHSEPEKLLQIKPELDKDLETVVLKCLEKKAEKRYSGSQKIADDLKSWLEGKSIAARPPSFWERFKKKILRQKAISIDDFVAEHEARQKAEAQNLELEHKLETETKREWKLVFEENFIDPKFEDRWDIYQEKEAKWEIKNGELRIWDGPPQILYLKQPIRGDIRMDFECYQEGDYLGDISCFLSVKPGEHPLTTCEQGYMFQYGGLSNTRTVLERSRKRIVDIKTPSIVAEKRFRVRAERIGARLSLTVNDETIFDVEDSEPLLGNDRSIVGFYGWRADTHFTSIRIYQLGLPVKADLIDLAEQQLNKKHYEAARDLYKEIVDSSTDANRKGQAVQGLKKATHCIKLAQEVPSLELRLRSFWPKAKLEIKDEYLSLDISYCHVTDLSPLRGLPISHLICASNKIASLEPLKGLPLKFLHCPNNEIQDLNPLRGMPLETINFLFNKVSSSLEALRGMPLTHITCDFNQINSLEPLRGMKLEFCGCSNNQITDIEAICGSSLIKLYCGSNQITSIEPLRETKLFLLSCDENPIKNLDPIKSCALLFLNCDGLKIKNIEALSGMPLENLDMMRNQVVSLEPLTGAPLKRLYCSFNPLSTLEPFVQKPPKSFFFSVDTIPSPELDRIEKIWSEESNYKSVLHSLKVLRALAEEDSQKLKQLCTVFQGKRYLYIPQILSWNDAEAFCKRLNGHLASITNSQTAEFLASLTEERFWIGLERSQDSFCWVSGVPYREDEKSKMHLKFGRHGIFFASGINVVNLSLHFSQLPFVIEWNES